MVPVVPEIEGQNEPASSEKIYRMLSQQEKEKIKNLLAVWYDALPNRVYYGVHDAIKEIATDDDTVSKTRRWKNFKETFSYADLPYLIAPLLERKLSQKEIIPAIEAFLTAKAAGADKVSGAAGNLKSALVFKENLEKLLKTTPKLTDALSGVALVLRHPLASLVFSGIRTASEYLELKNRKQRILLEIWLIMRRKYIFHSIQTALNFMANEAERPYKDSGSIKNALRKITPGARHKEKEAEKTAAQLHFLADMLADLERISGEIS